MELVQALEHPSLRPAHPVVRAAAEAVPGRTVRWVHSSEVLDIGPLLRGGELLLSGGTALATVSAADRRHYIAELAARRVAALAVQTAGAMPQLPADLIRAAEEQQLPLVELRSVVPFVEVTQSINSLLVSDSISTLRRADEVSHTVAVEMAGGADLRHLLEVIAEALHARVSLLLPGHTSPELINVDAPEALPTEPVQVFQVDITLRGVVAAALKIALQPGADGDLARMASGRVADVIALALLQQRPPSLDDIAGIELIRAVAANERDAVLTELCGTAGMDPGAPVLMLVARAHDPHQLRGMLEREGSRVAQRSVTYAGQSDVMALVQLPTGGSRRARWELLAALRGQIGALASSVCAGPSVDDIRGGFYSLAQARLTLDLAPAGSGGAQVFDSDDFVVDRMIFENLGADVRARLVAELLTELLDYDTRRGTSLAETLDAWLQSGCNTAQTARLLHLERQSLHNRLQRIFELVGGDPRGTGRLAGLQVALRVLRYAGSKYQTGQAPRGL